MKLSVHTDSHFTSLLHLRHPYLEIVKDIKIFFRLLSYIEVRFCREKCYDKFMSDLNITINQLEKDSSAALSSNGIEMVDDLLMGDETAHKKRTVDESNASAESGGIMRRVFVAGSIPSDYIAQLPGKIGQQILDQSAGDAWVQRDMLNYYVNEELKKLPVLDQIRVLGMPESEKIPTLLSLLEKMLVVGDY